MGEYETDRARVEPDVERVENRADARHGVMRLDHGRDVRRHDRHRVARPDTAARQGRAQPPAALLEFGVAVAPLAMDHGCPVWEDPRRAPQETDRRQRHVVGRIFVEAGFEDAIGRAGQHGSPPGMEPERLVRNRTSATSQQARHRRIVVQLRDLPPEILVPQGGGVGVVDLAEARILGGNIGPDRQSRL